jgi:RNA polymerase sigma-70 factor (ECF subfamily)
VAEEDLLLAPFVEDARRGEPGAFDVLVGRFRQPLFAYALKLLGDRGHAEDAVQEALVRAWDQLGALRDPESFRPWIYAILENAAFGGERHRERRKAFSLFDDEAVAEGEPALEIDSAPVEPGEEIPVAPVVAVVRESLRKLSGIHRQVLDLHYLQGRSTREVGEALDIPFNTARVRLFRARGALRRELARRGVGPEDLDGEVNP